jgi:hypothetical protein
MPKQIMYMPEDGSVYRGEFDDSDIDGYFGNEQFLAKIEREADAKGKIHGKITAASPGLQKIAVTMAKLRKLRPYMAGAPNPDVAKEYAKLRVQAREAAINDVSTKQLTIVQFVTDMIGLIQNSVTLTQAVTKINSNMLRGKVPEISAPNVQVQVPRLASPHYETTETGQTEYRLKRNEVLLEIPREDQLEQTIDRFPWAIKGGNLQLAQTRELLLLKACAGITSVTPTTIGDAAATTQGVMPRADNDVVGTLANLISSHFTSKRVWLNRFLMSYNSYRFINTNFYARKHDDPKPVTGPGVVPFVGLEQFGARAFLSPWCPDEFIYALGDEGCYELEGPKVVDEEYSMEKFARQHAVRDFVGYLLVNPSRFCAKYKVTADGLSTGTEITTHQQIATLLKAPATDKNDDA